MARTVRDAKLESPTARRALKPAGKPYYRAIDEGLHLGYRKGQVGGKWVMRRYVGGQTYQVETIATADDSIDADGATILSFGQAQALARARFVEAKRVAAGLPAEAGPYTVKLCLNEYLAWLAANGKTAKDARWRADALIIPVLGDVECAKLTTHQIRSWRDAVAKALPRIRTTAGKAQRFRGGAETDDADEAIRRRKASANRVLTVLKAALNAAWRDKKIASDHAWRAQEPFEEADAARVRYFTVEEANRLLNATQGEFRNLVYAALMTGCRFGELAALTVGDFNPDSGTLHIRTSKSGKGRHAVLTEEGTEFFKGICAGRAARDRMLWKADGGRWGKSHQHRPMRDACTAARIDPPANFHCLRHTYASLSVMNGAPLMVIARNLGHADTRMVEKHYGHLSKDFITQPIRAAAPRFGVAASDKVVLFSAVSRNES